MVWLLTFKVPSKICSRWHSDIFYYSFYFSEKINLDISCESSAQQTMHLKCHELFSWEKKTSKRGLLQFWLALQGLKLKVVSL